jgi:dihydroorotate dehydrogenase (fumarate)
MIKKYKQETISEYLHLIKEAKASINIPVIASVNCISLYEWTYFVKKIEEAGADAIELNIFYFPADCNKSAKSIEQRYLKIIRKIKSEVALSQ